MNLRRLTSIALICLSLPALAEPEPEAKGPATGTTPMVEQPATGQRSLEQKSIAAVDWAARRTSDLLATALSSLGIKYRRGAADPTVGFDCSGFVLHVYKEAVGLMLPHNAYSMSLQGKSVPLDELQPGDLVFFNTLKRQFSHVGIYLGDHRFIHAPSHGKGVQVDDMTESYWVHRFNGGRRMDTEASAQPARE